MTATTTNAQCWKCSKHLVRGNFDVVIGTVAFFLCDEHYKKAIKYFKV